VSFSADESITESASNSSISPFLRQILIQITPLKRVCIGSTKTVSSNILSCVREVVVSENRNLQRWFRNSIADEI
jgi:hypothetical protein